MSIDFDGISRAVLARATELLPQWFPNGKFQGLEFCLGDISGEPGDSLKFNIRKGCGTDFATGTTFGDIIDLYAQHYRVDLKQAAQDLADANGIGFKRNGWGQTPRVRAPKPERKLTEFPPEGTSIAPEVFTHHERAIPSIVHPYRDRSGRLMFVTCRYEADESRGQTTKAVLPWVWSGDTWACRGPEKPRPLYGLDSVEKFPTAPVIVVEGEKCVDAARLKVFTKNPVISWMNGAKGVSAADWSQLAGVKKAVIWPDADAAGHDAMRDVADALLEQGISVEFVDVADAPGSGWDVADAIAEGWSGPDTFKWALARRKPWPVTPEAVAAAEAVPEAAAPPPEPQGPEPSISQVETWERLDLARKGNGAPYASVDNALRILTNTIPPDALHYDPFLNSIRYRPPGAGDFEKLRDDHILRMQLNAQRIVGIQDMSKGVMADALALLARQRQRNSLQEWLKGLEWDGKERLGSLFVRGFGSADTRYHRDVGRCFLLGMVARAMRPGCQVDTMPILEGSQGIGKSRGLAALAGDYYADIDAPIGSKEFCEQIQGSWLVELSELSAMRPSEVERVKSGISRVVDKYREPFAILSSDHPRQCVFAGSTNAGQYLQDDTGNRRFWPVKCGQIDREWIADTRLQLFAEALHAVNHGACWWDVSADEAQAEAAARVITDTLHESVASYCASTYGDISVAMMLSYWDIPKSQWNAPLQKRCATALRALGYTLVHVRAGNVWRMPRPLSDNPESQVHNISTVSNVSNIRKARKLGE